MATAVTPLSQPPGATSVFTVLPRRAWSLKLVLGTLQPCDLGKVPHPLRPQFLAREMEIKMPCAS